MGNYNMTLKQTSNHATSIGGDHAQRILGFNPASSVQDLLQLLKTIREELDRIDIPLDRKYEAKYEVEQAIRQAKKGKPDKPALTDNLKNVAEIVKRSSTTTLGIAQFWTLIRKALEWAIS
jgi:hypothetical protein